LENVPTQTGVVADPGYGYNQPGDQGAAAYDYSAYDYAAYAARFSIVYF
jgi:hypothetical protein